MNAPNSPESEPPRAPARPPESAEPEKAPPAEVPATLRRRSLRRPGLWAILGQARRDFIGKDVQQTTTYSYVWSADQSGHFMLGFVPTFLIYWLCELVHAQFDLTWSAGPYPMLYSGLFVMALWTLLELYDLIDSIRKIRRSTGYFRPNTLNLIWNVVTALYYFGLGAVVAAASSFGPAYGFFGFLALFLLQLPMAIWWLRRKIIFQQAGLPYLYRLPNYDGVFDLSHAPEAAARENVVGFINELIRPPVNLMATEAAATASRQHLIVSGPQNSGKTSLGVGIATEFAFNGGIGRYITMSDLVQLVGIRATSGIEGAARQTPPAPPSGSLPSSRGRSGAPEDNEFNDGRILWKWASVDLLVIDDVIELLLPVRRTIENRLNGDGFRKEVEHEILTYHRQLVQMLGGEARAKQILDATLGEVQARLRVLASPETIAKYVAESFTDVLQAIRRIPRVVWVLGEMILPELFEDFVRKEFGFADTPPSNLLRLELLPPPKGAAT